MWTEFFKFLNRFTPSMVVMILFGLLFIYRLPDMIRAVVH